MEFEMLAKNYKKYTSQFKKNYDEIEHDKISKEPYIGK